jgi:hypothetical protein
MMGASLHMVYCFQNWFWTWTFIIKDRYGWIMDVSKKFRNKTTKYVFMSHISNICLEIIDTMYSVLCNVICLCLVVHKNSYAGLYNAQADLM